MKKSITFLSSILLVVLCMSMSVFAQQTTGELQGTVKDPAGAVIPNASVTISGVNVGFNQTIQTDNEGFFRARQLPPGTYRVTVAPISGFNQLIKEDVQVGLDNLTTLDLTVGTAVGATVNVTSDSGVIVDPTETKAQDNISAREIELLPKGTGFTSLLRTTASVRPEPISGQFSINGATGPENSFIIDGQETQNFRTGILNGNNDIPFQAVQEIQVKSSGFEAEFGGATGGVINAVSKSGTNQLRGEFGATFATEKLNAGPRPVLNTYLAFGPEVLGSRTGSSQGVEYLRQERDNGHAFFPSATLGGPIIKDKLWFFGIYAPRTTFTERTTNFIEGFGSGTCPTGATCAPPRRPVTISSAVPALTGAQTTQTSTFKRRVEYAQFKLDASPFNTLRLSSSYTWNPIIDEGALLGGTFVAASPSFATFGGQSFQGADLAARQGGRQNSNNFRVEGNWTPNSRLVTTVRYSRGFLNEKLGSYGIPTSTRIRCRGSVATAQPISGCLTGFQTTNNNFGVERDVSIRNTVDANASYLAGNLGGRHEIKGGYQYSKISNDVNSGTAMNGGITHLYYYTPGGARPAIDSSFVCNAWSPTVTFAVPANAVGRGCNQQFQTIGQASNTAHTLFVQDKWQPTDRLTLNLGVRAESEKIPSFNGVSNTGLEFDFSEKIAPRLGAAYALTGDGRTKISAFYGWFFDRLKFELPRGSFGGDYYHVTYFYIGANGAPTNYAYYTPTNILGNFTLPLGGRCPITATGTLALCDQDYRIPSNIGFPGAGAVDPDLKPYRQSEFTLEFQREVMRASVFTARYLRRNLDQVVEDAGIINAEGSEAYIIGNPGRGLHLETLRAAGYQRSVEAVRKYNALQLELDTRFIRNFSLNFNYVYSRLEGNYSGLGGTDENGRVSPNVLRAFDLPQVGFNASGGEDYGVLGLDRPHAFKASGTYSFDWWGSKANSTDVSFFTTAQSGLPQTSFVSVFHIPIPLGARNDLGRTERFTQTDLNLSHRYRFGRDDRFALAFDVNVLNVLNEHNVLGLDTNLTQNSYFDLAFEDVVPSGNAVTATNILTSSGVRSFLDPFLANPLDRNQAVGLPNQFQAPRSVRFGFRLLF